MILTTKIRLLPTKEQEIQLWKSAGTRRFIYNWALGKQIEHMKETGKLNPINEGVLRKELTQLKHMEEYNWLYNVSNNVAKQAVKDLSEGFNRFFDKSNKEGYKYRKSALKRVAKGGEPLDFTDYKYFPKFKARKKCVEGFYNDTSKLKVFRNEIYLEKVGRVKLAETERIEKMDNVRPAKAPHYKKNGKVNLTKADKNQLDADWKNPRITHDHKYWYISVGVEVQPKNIELTGESIGIDLGLSRLAVISNIDKPIKNINKTKEVKRLKKKLKRNKRKVSRKYEANKVESTDKKKEGSSGVATGEKNKKERTYKFIKTKNIEKLEQENRLIERRLSNIRLNHIHQATTMIVKTKPSRVVVEDLNITGLMKNRYLAKAFSEQCLHKFIVILMYKCIMSGIEFVKANRWYPSSKTCSKGGHYKKDLKLKDRVFICPKCDFKLDRDKNASINLANYDEKRFLSGA